jgi:hypothetical protein
MGKKHPTDKAKRQLAAAVVSASQEKPKELQKTTAGGGSPEISKEQHRENPVQPRKSPRNSPANSPARPQTRAKNNEDAQSETKADPPAVDYVAEWDKEGHTTPNPYAGSTYNHEKKLFPLAQGSSSVGDANTMVTQRKLRLDGSDDSDEETPAKEPTVEHAAVAEAQDNINSVTVEEVQGKKRTSNRIKAIGSASNKGCSPPLILYYVSLIIVSLLLYLYYCIFYNYLFFIMYL